MRKIFKLESKPSKLISDAQIIQLSENVVARYVFRGVIPEKDSEDVVMTMVEKFLLKQNQISQGFKGESKVTTYCIAVLNRMCCEVIRKEIKHWQNQFDEPDDAQSTTQHSAVEQLLINDEKTLLYNTFKLLGFECYKAIVFLAAYYKHQPKLYFVKKYDTEYDKHKLLGLLACDESENKGVIFDNLAKVVNFVEQKQVKPDAVRMWLNKTIDKIIIRLNGTEGRAYYEKESLQILFEYFYAENQEGVNK